MGLLAEIQPVAEGALNNGAASAALHPDLVVAE